jgi:hypothetical protein
MSSTTSEVSLCGLATYFWIAASLARSTSAAVGRPTSSSAPTPWWIWARALRSTAGSTLSTSEAPRASDSFRNRRSDLCAASSERRSSSCTQARALRSSAGSPRWVADVAVRVSMQGFQAITRS